MPSPGQAVFLVNTRSRRGRLAPALADAVGADRVLDLAKNDPVSVARAWQGKAQALVACGGDGTANWVLESARAAAPSPELALPVAVLPFGTGNDLARVLGTAPPEANPSAASLLALLERCQPSRLDRWLVAGPGHAERAWYNYLSWGADARAARRFDHWRRVYPATTRWRAGNKMLYGVLGLGESGHTLGDHLRLAGLPPQWAQRLAGASSLVLCNIASYAGGTRLHPLTAHDDGLLEAVYLRTGLAMGLDVGGVRRPTALGRRQSLEVILTQSASMQRDGEPCRINAGRWRVWHGGTAKVLAVVNTGPATRA